MSKLFFYALLLALLTTSCTSSLKRMKNGDYDGAIAKSVNKLKGKKQNEKEVLVLEEAYQKANNRDRDRINYLKKEGVPDNWNEIFGIYSGMRQRQEQVKPLLPLNIASKNRNAHIDIVNYDDEIIQAKNNAIAYYYAHALSLLETNNKTEARKAYNELIQVKNLQPNYKDVDKQLLRARNMGMSHALMKMKNTTGVPLPPTFEQELTKISLADLETLWLIYHTREMNDIKYDYIIYVNMQNIDVSPESVKEVNYSESKVVPDGFQYVLDAKGNVKKDSLGNDIKVPKTKTITCKIIENYQRKSAIIAGTLDYVNLNNGQLLKTDPLVSESIFEHRSAIAIGDRNALTAKTKQLLGSQPLPFPPSFDMLLQAGETLKNRIKNILVSNRTILY